MRFWKVPATNAVHLPPHSMNRNLFVYTRAKTYYGMIKVRIILLNAKTSLNDMLISATFRYGQLKSIKNQSHPHFHFDTHRSRDEGGKDKLNKTSTRNEKTRREERRVIMGCWMLFPFFLAFFGVRNIQKTSFLIFLSFVKKTEYCA